MGLGEEMLAKVGGSSPSQWSREIKRMKLDPGDVTGLLDHASPEALADPALDFIATKGT